MLSSSPLRFYLEPSYSSPSSLRGSEEVRIAGGHLPHVDTCWLVTLRTKVRDLGIGKKISVFEIAS